MAERGNRQMPEITNQDLLKAVYYLVHGGNCLPHELSEEARRTYLALLLSGGIHDSMITLWASYVEKDMFSEQGTDWKVEHSKQCAEAAQLREQVLKLQHEQEEIKKFFQIAGLPLYKDEGLAHSVRELYGDYTAVKKANEEWSSKYMELQDSHMKLWNALCAALNVSNEDAYRVDII